MAVCRSDKFGRNQRPHIPTGSRETVERGRVEGEVAVVRYHDFDAVVRPGNEAVESPTRDPPVPQLDGVDGFDRDPSSSVYLSASCQHGLNISRFGLHRQRQEPLRICSSYISVVSKALCLKDLVTASGRGTTARLPGRWCR